MNPQKMVGGAARPTSSEAQGQAAPSTLLFHNTVAPHLEGWEKVAGAARPSSSSDHGQAARATFLTHLHATLNAPSHPIRHPIRHRLLRLTADSPDLLAIIKAEGKV